MASDPHTEVFDDTATRCRFLILKRFDRQNKGTLFIVTFLRHAKLGTQSQKLGVQLGPPANVEAPLPLLREIGPTLDCDQSMHTPRALCWSRPFIQI